MEMKHFFVIILFVGLCHGVSKAAECTARGRFPNDVTDDCRGFTMCLIGGLTNFTQYNLTCPMGIYSHVEEQCTNATNYKCYPNFKCTRVGHFAVPESTDCSSFVACVEGLGGIVGTARVVGCPPNMLFNSTAGVCVNNTEFICTTHKTSVNHTVEDHVGASSNNSIITKIKMPLLLFIFLLQFVLC